MVAPAAENKTPMLYQFFPVSKTSFQEIVIPEISSNEAWAVRTDTRMYGSNPPSLSSCRSSGSNSPRVSSSSSTIPSASPPGCPLMLSRPPTISTALSNSSREIVPSRSTSIAFSDPICRPIDDSSVLDKLPSPSVSNRSKTASAFSLSVMYCPFPFRDSASSNVSNTF